MSYRLHASLGYHLSRAARVQERRLDEGLKSLGLTRTSWCVLLAVANEGLSRPSEIARFIGIDRTATSRALRGMEEDGLIARTAGAGDGRTTAVELTAFGRRRLGEGTPLARANNAVMAERLSARERTDLIRYLSRLTDGAEALKKL